MGSNENKSSIAEAILEEMLSSAVWRNVIWLHEGVAVYEIRNVRGYGMRWTLDVYNEATARRPGSEEKEADDRKGLDHELETTVRKDWKISKTTVAEAFSNLYEGLCEDHELDGPQCLAQVLK